MFRSLKLVGIFVLFAHVCVAQKAEKEFIREHINKKHYAIDSEASAIILFESQDIEVEKDSRTYVYTTTEHVHRIIKILRSDALESASLAVHISHEDQNHYINKLVGTTYNEAGNDIIETELGKTDIYKKKLDKGGYRLSFSFPGAKVGSIVEYSYDYVSPVYMQLPEWEVQNEYPKLLSTYRLTYSQQLEFTAITHTSGISKEYPSEKDALKGVDDYCHVRREVFNGGYSFSSFWLKRNIPAIKEEPYVYNLPNHIENMAIQLTRFRDKVYTNSWDKLNEELLKQDKFGKLVYGDNAFLDPITDSLKKKSTTQEGLIHAIYSYVRANFVVDRTAGSSLKTLKEILASQAGDEEQINLVLCAMLVHAGVDAAPLLIGTRGRRSPIATFPSLDRFNYVACAVKLDSNYVLLDASDRNNVYGMLPGYCYNGYARLIKKDSKGINLTTSLVKNKDVYAIRINDFTDSTAKISIVAKKGMITSSNFRKQWAKDPDAKKEYLDKQMHGMNENFVFEKSVVDNENNPDTNLVITYNGKLLYNKNVSNIFLNSQLIKPSDKNPFTSPTRKLPIEFSSLSQYQYYMTVQLPPDLVPDELPAPSVTDLDSGAITFKKLYGYYDNMHTLTIKADYSMNVTTFAPSYYDVMREFYQNMIKQEDEVITLKRKTGNDTKH